jgi:hypothetical protein
MNDMSKSKASGTPWTEAALTIAEEGEEWPVHDRVRAIVYLAQIAFEAGANAEKERVQKRIRSGQEPYPSLKLNFTPR